MDWWNRTPDDCEAALSLASLEGWVKFGSIRDSSEWPFDLPSVDLPSVDLPTSPRQPTEEVAVYAIIPPPGVLLGPLGYIQGTECASLIEFNDERHPGELWVRVLRMKC